MIIIAMQLSFEHFSKLEKFMSYILNRQPILNARAIFSDATQGYRIPMEPMKGENVKVRIRTAKDNIDEAFLCFEDNKIPLEKEYSDDLFDYYYGNIPPHSETVEYYFELNVGNLKCYYNKKGVIREPDSFYNFKIVRGFKTPDWAKGAVFYQIYVDRFYNGDTSNDVLDNEYIYIGEPVKQNKDWKKMPDAMDVREFYGGDLQGVIDKLTYLADLGIEVIYLNPIFVAPSNHKYDTQDYDYVDPHFGVIVDDGGEVLHEGAMDNSYATKYMKRIADKDNLEASNAFLAKLVEHAHQLGIKVILDGVFNHCGSFNKWLDREKFYEKSGYEMGAFSSKDSPYHSFFHFYNQDAWPNNPYYDGWWGHETLPKLNYEGSEKLYNYILGVAKKWLLPPYCIDGWRLDVAADLGYTKEFNHVFWRDFRDAVKSVNPEAIVLAEHYGDPSDWIEGDQWDTVMNYDAFMEPVSWFLTGMEKHSDEFRRDLLGNSKSFFDAMTHNMSRFHIQSLQVAMNELSNHDHSRFLTRTNHRVGRLNTLGSESANQGINKGIMREAVMIQMTWPGAPTIYYGDEAGLCGWTDPDNRRSYPWGEEDTALIDLHKVLIAIHKSYNALKTGSIKFLYGEYQVISYGRWDENDKFIIVINNHYESKDLEIPVWEIGINNNEIMQQMIMTTEEGFTQEEVPYHARKGKISITMPKYSAVLLKK